MSDANLSNERTVPDEPVTRAFDHPLPPVTLPEPFGPYHILRLLGQGGMGAVYLARDARLDRLVALKVPHFAPEDGAAARERFQRSARTAARLVHPNLCPIYEVGEFQGIPYLTMPSLEIPSLRSRLQEGLSPTPPQAAALVHRLAVALQAAHQASIVHRDLNPGNILLNPDGEPVIVDFGLARQLDADTSRLTHMGQMLGTPGYTAPEQLSGVLEAQGHSCDIFSLGVILYELLTGQLPFGRTLHEVLLHIMTREPVPPSVQNPGIDPILDRVCAKALARKVEERYASMGELATALLNYLRKQQEPIAQFLAGVNSVVPEAILSEDDSAAESVSVAGPITAQPVREVEPAAETGSRRPLWVLLLGATLVVGGLLALLLRWPTEKARVGSADVPFRTAPPANPEPRAPAPEILLCASNVQGKNQIVLLKRKRAGGADLEIVNTLTAESNNSDAVWSPDGHKIAFVSDRSGKQQIHVMDADGGNVQQITREKNGAVHPTWSPDGKKIAYRNIWTIVVSNADGTKPIRLSPPDSFDADPAWSPDGKEIAFCSKRFNNAYHLYVMDGDGANVRRLSRSDNRLGWVHPSWSPDGQRLAYGDFVDNGVELFVCDKDGTNARQLTRLGGTNYRASWTPDGKGLVFRRQVSNAPDKFALVQADGSGFQEMRTPLQGSDSGFLLWKPGASDPQR